jgi:carbon monoxide dehydrogenase subunit G
MDEGGLEFGRLAATDSGQRAEHMILNILIVVALLIVALLVFASTRPGSLNIERSISVHARPEKIFPLINDFRQWAAWSPYEKRDPAMKKTYSGASSGTGAVYEWNGNRQVGQGRMEIVDTSPPSRVTIKLDFMKPFEGHNVATFTIVPAGSETTVTWKMTGPSAFMTKVIGMFMNMDKMIGTDFEAGLASLKVIAEK